MPQTRFQSDQILTGTNIGNVVALENEAGVAGLPPVVFDMEGKQLIRPELRNASNTTVNQGHVSGPLTVDIQNGNIHRMVLSGNITLTINNPPTFNKTSIATLLVEQNSIGGNTITWPDNVVWAGSTPPSLTVTAYKLDIIRLITYDGGETWFGFVVGLNYPPFRAYKFNTPDTDPEGVVFNPDTNNIITVDDNTDLIYVHNGVHQPTLTNYPAPAGPFSVAIDPSTGNLIVGGFASTVYEMDGVSGSVLNTISSMPAGNITGLHVDASTGNLIMVSSSSNAIYEMDGISNSVLNSFFGPEGGTRDVTIDTFTGNLISIADGTDLITIHSGITDTTTSNFASPGTNPRGITFDTRYGNIIVIDGNGIVYVHNRIQAYDGA